MTAPGPDLDALAHTVDAMRQAGVSGVTLSVDEADALIAAAREREQADKDRAQAIEIANTANRARDAARAALTELEWHDNNACPSCGQAQEEGHAPDCWLDAALAEGQDG